MFKELVIWHSFNYAKLKWQSWPKLVTSSSLCIAIPWFTHRVQTGGVNQCPLMCEEKNHKNSMEKQKELKQVVAFGQPALVRIPTYEIGEIVSGRTYWQQMVQKVAYSHLDVFVRHHTPKQWEAIHADFVKLFLIIRKNLHIFHYSLQLIFSCK